MLILHRKLYESIPSIYTSQNGTTRKNFIGADLPHRALPCRNRSFFNGFYLFFWSRRVAGPIGNGSWREKALSLLCSFYLLPGEACAAQIDSIPFTTGLDNLLYFPPKLSLCLKAFDSDVYPTFWTAQSLLYAVSGSAL